MKTGRESWDYPAWRREGPEGSYQCIKISEWKVQRTQRRALFSGDKTSGNGHNLKLRKLLLYMKKILYCEGDQAHAQLVQRVCGVSVHGNISVVQAWPRPAGSRCPCLSRSVGPVSGGTLEPQKLCDSMTFMHLKEPRPPISPNGLRSSKPMKMSRHKCSSHAVLGHLISCPGWK